ncbi:hypothetical protein [Amycolatopsis silviterrae]|uniref:Nudix hydrolase domain-containing protein n=1 Tax=Amycolatopsis silviterrae TaxID=1656914 RepID=A0ABW5H9G6_9PSEU
MGKLTRRARATADYLFFVGAGEWPVAVSALGVVLGAVTILPSAFGVAVSIVALLLGLLTLVRDIRLLRKRWAGYEFTAIAAPFPIAETPPPRAYPDSQYVAIPARGTALVSDGIDAALTESTFSITLAEDPYRLPAKLKATAPHVLPLRARGRLLFNGPIIGMRGEPLPASGARPAPIALHRARFFDAVCSNELASLRITNTADGREYDLRHEELTDSSGALRSLAASTLADLIGVSTIAFTSDGLLVVVRQSARNSASGLLLAPSGSGSLEPQDLLTPQGGTRRNLHTAVSAGMERELCEEAAVRPDEISSTRLTGFARWLERGAKPEFFGVTQLSVDSAELTSRRTKSAERLYSAGVTVLEVDLAALGQELTDGVPLIDASALPARLRDDGSLPLLLCLRSAALRVSTRS